MLVGTTVLFVSIGCSPITLEIIPVYEYSVVGYGSSEGGNPNWRANGVSISTSGDFRDAEDFMMTVIRPVNGEYSRKKLKPGQVY